MKVTYYLEILSSWCHWVESVWAELKQRYAGRYRDALALSVEFRLVRAFP